MTKTIKINISDPVTDALVKSQTTRLAVLESLIKKKKKTKDVAGELRSVNGIRSDVKRSEARIKSIEKKTNAMIDALKNRKTTKVTIVNTGMGQRVLPSPA